MMANDKVLLGMGNPLLDMSVDVNKEFLAKYGVKGGDILMVMPENQEKLNPVYADVQAQKDVQYIAGGATQNSIRVAQWMLSGCEEEGTKGKTAFIGCIGKDKNGEQLAACMKKDNVQALYKVDEKEATGTCAVLVDNKERCLIAKLNAAEKYTIDHLKGKEASALLNGAQFVYIAGYFITHSFESMLHVAKTCLEQKKKFMLNISAPFLLEVPFFLEKMKQILPYCDVIFCNETEAAAYAKAMKFSSKQQKTLAFIAAEMSELRVRDRRDVKKLSLKENGPMVVVTCGSDDVIIATKGETKEYEVPAIRNSAIVDTNGAGDSFVGGFIAAMIKGKEVEDCVNAGNFAAGQVIQMSGCQPSGTPEYNIETGPVVESDSDEEFGNNDMAYFDVDALESDSD